MERLVVGLLVCIVAGHLMDGVSSNPPCQWSGFGGCQCNILGACGVHIQPTSELNTKTLIGYAPSGLEIFSIDGSQKQNLAYLCEGNTVAILYDCNKRIPLYAATVMSGDQMNAGGSVGRSSHFKQSNDHLLNKVYLPGENDYSNTGNREICYQTKQGLLIDSSWYKFLNSGKEPPSLDCHQPIPAGCKKKVAVHRGHLIAAGYGRVGAIPSTYMYNSAASPRYFGSGGFSNYMDVGSYRINVPSMMWTAACCTFQMQDDSEETIARYTAFWRENNPGTDTCTREDIIREESLFGKHSIDLFSASHSSCSDSKNYRPIYG
ncbi:hypothetical protein ACROYT_G007300 [Oculina patagonica]